MLGRKILTRNDLTVLTPRPIPFPKQQKVNLGPGYRASKGDQVLVLLWEDRACDKTTNGIANKKTKCERGSDTWLPVPPISVAILINIGDALQILSNGRYKSIQYRVIANDDNNRVSVPIFVNPKPNDVIGPLQEVLENGEKQCISKFLLELRQAFLQEGS
ncbi:Feruloyl CoA ortho-hydroxylase 1 [Capsicum chinense]|nr:Feruloyl CoA ortho-hydroxylase 1 [Capsicum chinense]